MRSQCGPLSSMVFTGFALQGASLPPSPGVGFLGGRVSFLITQLRGSAKKTGARVRTNVMVRDLYLLPHDRVDSRRLEVVADGLPAWGSAAGNRHHTCDTLARDGSVTRGADRTDGAVLVGRRRKECTYFEWQGWVAGPTWSSSLLRLASLDSGVSTVLDLFGIRQGPLCVMSLATANRSELTPLTWGGGEGREECGRPVKSCGHHRTACGGQVCWRVEM